jgi:hypothetical protein
MRRKTTVLTLLTSLVNIKSTTSKISQFRPETLNHFLLAYPPNQKLYQIWRNKFEMPLIQGWLCSIDVLKYIYYRFWMIFTSKSVLSFQSGIIWFGILNNKSFSVGNYVEHGIWTFKSKLLNFMRNVLAKSAETLWLCVYLLFRKENQIF